jgi:hypothetical protein
MGSVVCIRCELLDGLRISVIRKLFSDDDILFVLLLGDEILKNDVRFVLELLFGIRENDVDGEDD